jgi:hypothetical protein
MALPRDWHSLANRRQFLMELNAIKTYEPESVLKMEQVCTTIIRGCHWGQSENIQVTFLGQPVRDPRS